jgi:hypothetical protein
MFRVVKSFNPEQTATALDTLLTRTTFGNKKSAQNIRLNQCSMKPASRFVRNTVAVGSGLNYA